MLRESEQSSSYSRQSRWLISMAAYKTTHLCTVSLTVWSFPLLELCRQNVHHIHMTMQHTRSLQPHQTARFCPDWQHWGQPSQQYRQIVCPVKKRWFHCWEQNQRKNLCWVLKIDVACLCLFCELAKMMERLVFDGEKKMRIMHFKVAT